MKVAVAISSMQENAYFDSRARRLFDAVEYLPDRPTAEQMPHLLSKYDVLIVGARERIAEDMLVNDVRTTVVGTLSVGLDHLDLTALERRGIDVINTPYANVRSVAEHVIASVLALAKRLKEADRVVQKGGGRRELNGLPAEVQGKTLGLIGFGKIGQEVAGLAKCLGFSVVAVSRSRQAGEENGVHFRSLKNVLEESFAVSVSVPLTAQTERLISRELIDIVAPGAIIVNTSRPEVVDSSAVRDALLTGRLGGYAGDYDSDPSALSQLPNALITPHLAGMTNEANDRLDNELIDRLATHLSKRA